MKTEKMRCCVKDMDMANDCVENGSINLLMCEQRPHIPNFPHGVSK